MHVMWRNPRALYNLVRKSTSRNECTCNWNAAASGPVWQLFSKTAMPHWTGAKRPQSNQTTHWLPFTAVELCLTKHGLQVRMSRITLGPAIQEMIVFFACSKGDRTRAWESDYSLDKVQFGHFPALLDY